MVKSINSKNSFSLAFVLNIAYLLFLTVDLFVKDSNISNDSNWVQVSIVLLSVSIILNIYFLYSKRIPIWDFRTGFVVLSYLFIYGRVLLAALDLEGESSWLLQDEFTNNEMGRAAFYSLACTQALFVGFFVKGPVVSGSYFNCGSLVKKPDLLRVAVLCLCITLPCRLITDYEMIIAVSSTGMYTSAVSGVGIVDDFGLLFLPSIICLCEAIPQNRKKIILAVAGYYLIIMALSGDRRYYVTGILSMSCYYWAIRSYREKKRTFFKGVKNVALIYLALVFLNFLEIVRHIRSGDLVSLSSFINSYGLDVLDLSNLFIDVSSEFGISFYSIVLAVKVVSNGLFPLQYGSTFLYSLVTLVPFGTHLVPTAISPSDIVNASTGLPVGATLIGDMYYNFGSYGIVCSFFLAFFISSFFDKIVKSHHPLSVVLYFTCYYVLINLVRATIVEVARPFVWGILMLVFFYNILKGSKKIENKRIYT